MDVQPKEQEFKALIFRVGQEEYGVNINQVVSIERMQKITPYPNRQPHVLGVTTIRNVVTPIVDLRTALIGESVDPDDGTRMIIVQVEQKEIGLVVDSATDVIDIARDTIQHPNLMETKNVSFLEGVSKLDTRLIILLDIEKLLVDTTNLDDLRSMKDAL